MNVDELLDLMEETLEEGTAMPFSAGKRVVDVDKMRDIIDDVRANLPDEMRQSKKIVEDRERIVQEARQEADGIIKQAEERAKVITSEQEIVKRAQKRGVEILTTAQNQAREISKSATTYCDHPEKYRGDDGPQHCRRQKHPHEPAQRRQPRPTQDEVSAAAKPCRGRGRLQPARPPVSPCYKYENLLPAAVFDRCGLVFCHGIWYDNAVIVGKSGWPGVKVESYPHFQPGFQQPHHNPA